MDSHGIRLKDLDGKYKYPVPYFPIGYIYLSTVEIDASTLNERYGGTWEQIKDMFLLCCGDKYSAGSTGGESEHTLTTEEIPSHQHNLWKLPLVDTYGGGTTAQGYTLPALSSKNAQRVISMPTGGDQPHNNMPPYLAVYAYQRIS